ncbi:hypothetical protein [uncultured Thiodictyon sp.]|uniref:hypothetical protein n=1 Tax=uncultured Thiodictyon sp. TaxID=1846217 RepID=UPI0025FA3D92|nr:hypothetical protein [uncultured Thiodictyon sp.]
MHSSAKRLTYLPLAVALSLYGQTARSEVDREDLQVINAASCAELLEEYRDFAAAEKELTEALKQHGKEILTTNLLGAATMATLGFGFFTWDDDAEPQENLAELHDYRVAIGAGIDRKRCRGAAAAPPPPPRGKAHN